MKVMFFLEGLTHYYNLVLNKLGEQPGINLVNVVPTIPDHVGAGVYRTKEGIRFKYYEFEPDGTSAGHLHSGKLWRIVVRERPSIIVLSIPYLNGLLSDAWLRFIIKLLGIKIVLKSIPFQHPRYESIAQECARESEAYDKSPSPKLASLISGLPGTLRDGWLATGITRSFYAFRRVLITRRTRRYLQRQRYQWNYPDAHVNYIEKAYDIFGSYGVPRKKIFITYNSPDTDALLKINAELEARYIGKQCRRIIHVGRLVQWKRVDLLIETVRVLKPKYDDIELVVIGDGPQKSEWEQLAAGYGLQRSIHFKGGVYDPYELGRQFKESALYVLAGMGGLSINEAMCFGMPVVCSECDGTERYLVKEGVNGMYFRAGDAADLARVVDDLLSDPERLLLMGQESSRIIDREINIHTVIAGYLKAFSYLKPRAMAPRPE